jgi:uncharacterized protein YlxP (DUF503 family)
MSRETIAHVGIAEVTIRLHAIDSLKGKRGIAKSLIARVHNRFNVSIAEVHHLDSHQLLGITVAAVSSSKKVTDAVLAEVVSFMEEDRRFEVESFSTELI